MKIVFYRTAGGASLVERFLEDLDAMGARRRSRRAEDQRDFWPSRCWSQNSADQGQALADQVAAGGDLVLVHATKKEGREPLGSIRKWRSRVLAMVTGKKPSGLTEST